MQLCPLPFSVSLSVNVPLLCFKNMLGFFYYFLLKENNKKVLKLYPLSVTLQELVWMLAFCNTCDWS